MIQKTWQLDDPEYNPADIQRWIHKQKELVHGINFAISKEPDTGAFTALVFSDAEKSRPN